MRPWPYSPAGRFLLYRPGQSEPAARLGSRALTLLPREGVHAYDALVRVDDQGPWIEYVHQTERFGGRLEGLTWVRSDGEHWRLIPDTGAPPPGLAPRLNDPDAYRAALALHDALEEVAPESEALKTVARQIELATFYRCPACGDAFSLREDCTLCQGEGFVSEWVDESA